jgi:cytoskeletal protein RodZ
MKSAKKRSYSLYSTAPFKLLVVLTIAAVVVWTGHSLAANYQPTNVLGASTFIVDNEVPSQNSDNSQPSVAEQTQNHQTTPEPTEAPQQNDTHPGINMEALNKVEFQSENGQTQVHLENGNSSIEISSEGGKLSIKAKNENGTEVQLQADALDKINEALKGEDIQIATTSGNGFLLRKGQFEAETHFPLSINPTTNQLTVTTPAGVKTVTVLPDQAVNNLLQQRLIDSVASSSANTGIVLGLLNNQPAFQVNGVDDKKLLGLVPISIDKTSYVSAQTGQVLKVNETFLNQLLDLLSTQ